MLKITKFIAHDGKEFHDEESCALYEKSLGFGDDEDANKYLQGSYAGNELLKKHNLDDVGVWNILGEDPNPDFGGNHTNPNLGYLSGKLYDVVKEAVKMKGFYVWGSGGRIVQVSIREI